VTVVGKSAVDGHELPKVVMAGLDPTINPAGRERNQVLPENDPVCALLKRDVQAFLAVHF
jgi:hypothetical protein